MEETGTLKSYCLRQTVTNMQRQSEPRASARIYIEALKWMKAFELLCRSHKNWNQAGALHFQGGCRILARRILWQVDE